MNIDYINLIRGSQANLSVMITIKYYVFRGGSEAALKIDHKLQSAAETSTNKLNDTVYIILRHTVDNRHAIPTYH